jgi:hypothetical protein
MEFSNQSRSKQIKRTFNIAGIIIVLIGLVFLWLKLDIMVLVTAGIFAVYVGVSIFANLCYVSFSTANEKVLIRYYPILSIMKKEYDSIEFAHNLLAGFQIQNTMGFADLEIAIKTKRGVAEYPTISLSALSKDEIEQIRSTLTEILGKNKFNIKLKS